MATETLGIPDSFIFQQINYKYKLILFWGEGVGWHHKKNFRVIFCWTFSDSLERRYYFWIFLIISIKAQIHVHFQRFRSILQTLSLRMQIYLYVFFFKDEYLQKWTKCMEVKVSLEPRCVLSSLKKALWIVGWRVSAVSHKKKNLHFHRFRSFLQIFIIKKSPPCLFF